MICIYRLISPTNKVYIGQTFNFRRRIRRYEVLDCRSQKKLHNSLIKHGFENHEVSILYEFPEDITRDIVNKFECLYIEFYKESGVELLNLTDGGDGTIGYKFTDEDRVKLSKSLLGKKAGKSTKLKMSNYSKNRTNTHIQNLSKSISKPVLQFTLAGNLVKEWPCLKCVSKEFGFVRGCINGRQKSAGGYFWKYKD